MKLARLIIHHWPIIVIILIAATLRFWRLEALTTFGSDQGYDFLIVKKILEGDLTLLGPKIGPYNELGNLYLGPAYYYLLAPALFLFHLDPVGPAFLTVIFSLCTIFLIYFICAQFFSKTLAIIASGLYAINSLLINQSRAPSNPHLIPFFSALIIYSVLKMTVGSKSKIWPIITGLSIGIAFQLHYLAISLLVSVIFVLGVKKYLQKLLIVIGSFFVAISPQMLFELRNDFFVSKLFIKQIQAGSGLMSPNLIIGNFLNSSDMNLSILIGLDFYKPLIVALIIWFIIFLAKSFKDRAIKTWLIFAIIFLNLSLVSFYWGDINVHYLTSSYPAVFILAGLIITSTLKFLPHPILRTLVIMLVSQIIAANLLSINLNRTEGYTMPNGWNLAGIKKTSRIIAQEAKGTNFNVAATLDGDTRAMPYRYMLDVFKVKPQGVEKYPESENLYLISRDDPDKIKEYTVWEVAVFLPLQIENLWEIQNGIKLYKISRIKQI